MNSKSSITATILKDHADVKNAYQVWFISNMNMYYWFLL